MTAGPSRWTGLRGRIARIIAASTIALVVVGTTTVGPAAAARNDPRISPAAVECINGFVRTQQPFVYGNSPTYETIYWMPFLEARIGSSWFTVAQWPHWMNFQANSTHGSYPWYYANTKIAPFSATPGYDYRIGHLIYWSSTREYGTAPAAWLGSCRL